MPRFLLAAAASLGWIAVLTQFVLSIRSGLANGHGVWHGVVEYFGYFTLLTNILCAGILSAFLHGQETPLRRFLRRPGVVAATWNPKGIDLVVDTLLHTVNPLLFVFAWTRLIPRGAVTLAQTPWWMSYILGYAAYTLVRGAVLGRYPYPFIDVTQLGYPTALRNAALLGLAFVALSAVMVGVNRVLGVPRTVER
jgi:hypothetical protein